MRRARKPTLAVTLPIPLASVLVILLAGCQADESAGSAALGDEARTHLRQIASEAPAEVAQGKRRFEQNCSVCHGPAADGTAQGPPLAHKIYEPNHHADAAFTLAVRLGVRSHHWRFGDMPALPHVTDDVVGEITAYVRWLQRQVGIQ
jgi:mono/diheme cytochrome c family protein